MENVIMRDNYLKFGFAIAMFTAQDHWFRMHLYTFNNLLKMKQ